MSEKRREYLITATANDGRVLSVKSTKRETAIRFVEIFMRYDFYSKISVTVDGKSWGGDQVGDLP